MFNSQYLINEAQIMEEWGTRLEQSTGISNNPGKIAWMAKYAHYHTVNESFSYSSTSTLGNTPGMGAVRPASAPGGPGAFHNGTPGSGDLFPALLPIALQVANRTVGFDIVSVIPMPGPAGTLVYFDYIYGGGKINGASKPLVVKIDAGKINSVEYVAGTQYWGVSGAATAGAPDAYVSKVAVELIFVGRSFVSGEPIFRVGETYVSDVSGNFTKSPDTTLAEVFDATAVITTDDSGEPLANDTATTYVAVTTKPQLVTALEDHIKGYAGSGTYDSDAWTATRQDGTMPVTPMGRGTGETTYYRPMGMTAFTKFVEADTYQVTINVTTEQIQDLNRQFGIDVLSMSENVLINELSQSINAHILSRAFALGWSHNSEFLKAEGVTLNFTLDAATTTDGSATYINKLGQAEAIKVNKFQNFGSFENMNTIQARVMAKILAAGNIISLRSKRGPANFAVVNGQIGTALQIASQYTISPINNTINQQNGSLFPVGSIAGINIYTDPTMAYNDYRILVGRKGADDEPGMKFMPYLMAESMQTIAENTMAPKIAVKSRYALVDAGQHPQVMYYTMICSPGTLGSIV